MSQVMFRTMIAIGLFVGAAGLVTLYFAGGWAATGIGTNHSGTGAGVVGVMLTGWGAVLVVATLFTAAMMRATGRRTPAAR